MATKLIGPEQPGAIRAKLKSAFSLVGRDNIPRAGKPARLALGRPKGALRKVLRQPPPLDGAAAVATGHAFV